MDQSIEGRRIACLVSGCSYTGHILTGHLRKVHNMEPEQYAKSYPGAKLMSPKGMLEFSKRVAVSETPTNVEVENIVSMRKLSMEPGRTTCDYAVKDTFGFPPTKEVIDRKTGAKKTVPGRQTVVGFEKPGPLTPAIDPSYVFPPDQTMIALLGMHLRDKVLTYGPTGSGKTQLWTQLAARLNYNLVRINFDSAIQRSDLVGRDRVRGREIFFQHGILPRAMTMAGTIILLDEWDTIDESVAFVLQRVLEEDGQLLIPENGDELVPMHPQNVLVATANTAGMGDESGLYSQGTRVQNFAQINRFNLTVILDYLSADFEKMILKKKFDQLDDSEIAAMVDAVNKVRTGYTKGEFSAPLSTRDLVNWAEKYLFLGSPMKAASYCFLNRMPSVEREAVRGILQRIFGV